MVATEFLGYIQSFAVTNRLGFEDLADRANFQWNVIVLLISMTLVTLRQYFMAPLVCYLPTSVTGANAESYITNLCWVEGTFPINLTSGFVPHKASDWDALLPFQMNYYQWVPLVLGLQAILYYLPNVFWGIFTYNRTGMDLQNLIRSASSIAREDGEKRSKMIQHVARTLEILLFNRREYRGTDGQFSTGATLRRIFSFMPGKRHGKNLFYIYLLMKVFYLVIGACQLYLMYFFLRFDSHQGYFFFGFRILSDIIRGKLWSQTQIFPRVGMCRQTLQHVGASNRFFAQCVLPINMLNEKIYIFLYFFLGGVMLLTLFSIPIWLYRMCMPRRQRHFVRRFLRIADAYDEDDPKLKSLIDKFVVEFLRHDGHFILRMLSMNAGDLITVEIVCCLFGDFKRQFLGKDFRGPRPPPGFKIGSFLLHPLRHANQKRPDGDNGGPNGNFMSANLNPAISSTARNRGPYPSAPSDDPDLASTPRAPPYPEPSKVTDLEREKLLNDSYPIEQMRRTTSPSVDDRSQRRSPPSTETRQNGKTVLHPISNV